MKRFATFLAAATLLAPASALANASATDVTAAMDQVWANYKQYAPGACLGAIDDGIAKVKCYGHKSSTDATRPDEDTLWMIGSLSKTFTSTLLADRLNDPAPGSTTLHLGDAVRSFVVPTDGQVNIPPGITLRDFAQHYGGLPQDLPSWSGINTYSDMYKTLSECYVSGNTFCPGNTGTSWSYSNLGFDWLGQIIARHDGYSAVPSATPWEQDLRDTVLTPLRMPATGSTVNWNMPVRYDTFVARKASGNVNNGDGTFSEVAHEELASGAFGDPAGGLWSSGRDMMTWLQYSRGAAGPANLAGALTPLWRNSGLWRTRAGLTSPSIGGVPGTASYVALGWTIAQGSPTMVAKGGTTNGFESYMEFPTDGTNRAVFVLVNVGGNPDGSGGVLPTTIGCTLMRQLPPVRSNLACAAGL